MSDDKSPTIEELLETQAALQESFEYEQKKFQSARKKFAKKKQALTDFNQKYARMLKAVLADAAQAEHLAEAAAEAEANAPEVVVITPDDVGTVPVEDIVNNPPVDTSAEE